MKQEPRIRQLYMRYARTRERTMSQTNEMSYHVPFTSNSGLAEGFHVSAALGGGVPHAFLVDTGSGGILVPRKALGPDFGDRNDNTYGRFTACTFAAENEHEGRDIVR
jgi:hypothetical protein